jgi:hypothetical protein
VQALHDRGVDRHTASPPVAVAEYLKAVKQQVGTVSEVRQRWIREIGRLLEDARRSNRQMVAQAAGRVGRAYLPAFQEAHARVGRFAPPRDCLACHRAVVGWLEAQVASCEIMIDVAANDDVGKLRDAQRKLAEGRLQAHLFNDEYARLVAHLREQVDAAGRRHRERERHQHGTDRPRGRHLPHVA